VGDAPRGGGLGDAILRLQRSAGNRAATKLVQRNGDDPLTKPYKKSDQQRSTKGHGGERKAKWLRERDAQIAKVERFMEDVVGPWATQARIAELINTNFEEMKRDPNLSSEVKYLHPAEKRKPEATDPQIAPGDVKFVAPTRTATTAIHRGIVAIEMIDDTPYARVYSALWAEARPNKEGKVVFKDVHQDPHSGKVTVHTGRDQGEKKEGAQDDEEKHPIMWLSGEPLRQLKWFYKYPIEKYNPGARPVVRSFLIPLELWNRISEAAVSEDEANTPGNETKPFNVDTAYGSNQFGVRGPLLDEIRKKVADSSLISYVGDPKHSKASLGGDVRPVSDLHEALGAPETPAPKPIWIDPEVGKFVRTKQQGGIADKLAFYYGVWKDNDSFLDDKDRRIPKQRRQDMLKKFLAENGLHLPAYYTFKG
jgi:hypothetical protein